MSLRALPIALSAALLFGCPAAAPPRSQFPNGDAALKRLHETQACGTGVQASAKIDHFGEQGRFRISMLLFATSPANLRLDAVSPFGIALATLTARLKRRSLIVLFSDFADTTSAQSMLENIARLVRHHLVIFVTMVDTELEDLAATEPDSLTDIAVAVGADTLARSRALVLQKLRRLGVDVIEAPYQSIGYRLIDVYLKAKQAEAIG